eukprot:1350738-Alexandrium_andersonii.AAC.1
MSASAPRTKAAADVERARGVPKRWARDPKSQNANENGCPASRMSARSARSTGRGSGGPQGQQTCNELE